MSELQTLVLCRNGCNRRTPRTRWVVAAVAIVLLAVGCGSGASAGVGPQTRAYYISADEVAWNYVPSGKNMITGKQFDETANTFLESGPDRIGSTYTKCVYHGYTDATFTHQLQRSADEQYLGLLGPVIRAQVGDTITVMFRKTARSRPASIRTVSSTTRKTRAPRTTTAGLVRTRLATRWPPRSSMYTPGRYLSALVLARWTAVR
jgi:hypothetical protein